MADDLALRPQATEDVAYSFGPFRLSGGQQSLTLGGQKVAIGSRALALLLYFVQRRGEVVGKRELMEQVWPQVFVDEVNLRVQIAAVRRALSDQPGQPTYIASVSGRGYRFIADVVVHRQQPETVGRGRATLLKPTHSLPSPVQRVIGRDKAVARLTQLLARQRLVTIVGPGGIGKTTVALLIAGRMQQQFPGGVFLVDLATVSEARFVGLAVASALQVAVDAPAAISSIVQVLRSNRAMLVLDNCEHVIEAAARLAEDVLRAAPGVTILATSHEALAADGEVAFRLPPLGLPSDEATTLDAVLQSPAAELFVERLMAQDGAATPTDAEAPQIVEICRRLDGVPLALELAAAGSTRGQLSGLAGRLDDLMRLNHRRATARHGSLQHLLDWSHANLSEAEQVVLRRISVFSGPTDMEGAIEVSRGDGLSSVAVTAALAGLVRKSLLFPTSNPYRKTYRLLEATRHYARNCLSLAGEAEAVRRRHAEHLSDLLVHIAGEWERTPRAEWLETWSYLIDDLRVALDWAFSDVGDARIGVRLTAHSLALGMHAGLIDEFRGRTVAALDHAARLSPPEAVAELRLNCLIGVLEQNQNHPSQSRMACLIRAMHLADQLGEPRYKIEALLNLAGYNLGMGQYTAGVAYARHASDLARGHDLAELATDRLLALCSFHAGDFSTALTLSRRVLNHRALHMPFNFGSMQVDKRVSMRSVLARLSWLDGQPGEAIQFGEEALAMAPEDGAMAICQTLTLNLCLVLLWIGDNDRAEPHVRHLIDYADRYGLRHWHSWGLLFERVIRKRRGEAVATPELQGDLQRHTLITLDIGMAAAIVPTSGVGEVHWCSSEIVRARGELLLAEGNIDEAAQHFEQSLALARRQGALMWELRAAMACARLLSLRNRKDDAVELLRVVHARFAPDQVTADLLQCRQLLGQLR